MLMSPSLPLPAGIVVDGCADVTITGVHVSTASDAISIKTSSDLEGSSDIRVTKSLLVSRSSGFSIGSETRANIRRVSVQDCQVSLCARPARWWTAGCSSQVCISDAGRGWTPCTLPLPPPPPIHCHQVRAHRGLSISLRDGGSVLGVSASNISVETQHEDPAWCGCRVEGGGGYMHHAGTEQLHSRAMTCMQGSAPAGP